MPYRLLRRAPFAILATYMANHISSLKRVRQTERWTEMNRRNKMRLRHQIRAMRRVVAGKDPGAAAALLPKTFSIIDRSAKIGIIKKNTAARYKSKLHLKLKALQGAAK
jgi:small subunit ribosomal protein S20